MNLSRSAFTKTDTICAIATPPGTGAISVIRLSGPESLSIARKYFNPVQKKSSENSFESHK
ncbi:MAG: hypothetical protein C0591_11965, partial [Marinilabiliales bacterium]